MQEDGDEADGPDGRPGAGEGPEEEGEHGEVEGDAGSGGPLEPVAVVEAEILGRRSGGRKFLRLTQRRITLDEFDGLALRPSSPMLPGRTFLSDTGDARGSGFVRRIRMLGTERGIEVRWVAHRGKGSHGLLYYGSKRTTVRDLKDEVDKRAYHNMLKQLGLSEEDVAGRR